MPRMTLAVVLMLLASSLVLVGATAPAEAAGETVKFAAIGDYGYSHATNEQAVADIVDAEVVDLIITTGDNSYNSPSSPPSGVSQIDWNIGKSYADYIGAYSGSYGSGATTNQFFPAPGNHDYTDGDGISAYLSYFTLPGAGITSPGTSGSELYYDFVEGPVHFFAIDSDVGQSGVDIEAQKTWLQTQLAASTAQWKVVYFHHVAFSSSTSHGSSAYMQWPFEAWGADAVLGGHDHVYERILRDDNADGTDMVYITTGAGGKSLYGFSSNPSTWVAGSQVRYNANYGTVIAEATDTELTFEFWSITGGGTLIDTYTLGPNDPPEPDFSAFNDLGWGEGQSTLNITRFTSPNGGSGLGSSGELVDFGTGGGTGVNLTVTGGTFDGGNQADTHTAAPVSGTDAYGVFAGKLDALGTISYQQVAPPAGNLVLTLDSLDPGRGYEIVLYGHRGDYDLEARAALMTLTGADDFVNESTAGSDFSGPGDDSTRMAPDNVEGYVARWTGVRAGSDGVVEIVVSYDGTVPGDDEVYKGKYVNALALFDEGTGGPPVTPSEWVAYNDLNTSAGVANPAYVTSYTYATGGALRDFASGVVLPAVLSGSAVGGYDPHGNGGPVTNVSSDAFAAFDGIVDLSGTDELDAADWDHVLTFSGLDSDSTYAVTLSANRMVLPDNGYPGERFARVTIEGVDASTAASSAGVVVNSPTSVSFSVGDNAANGYVAKWVDIDPGADGVFTVKSEWDDSLGSQPPVTGEGHDNIKGYAMSAVKLEAFDDAPPSGFGLLRVVSSPAVPTQVVVDGVPMDSWGLQWVKVPVGSHAVSFTDVQGFTTPADEVVVVADGATTEVSGTFAPRGWLRVMTSPAVPSTVSVDGAPMNDWGVWTDLEAGSYEVCYGAVADYTAPSCETVAVTAGVTTEVTGTFVSVPGSPGPSGYGLLRVTTSPAVPAQILVDGVAADSWGLNWVKVAPGAHTVSFTDVEGFSTPGDEAVTVTAGEVSVVTGDYVQRGSLQVATSPAVAGTILVDGLPRDDWGMWTHLPVDSYEVCYGDVGGFTAPGCETVAVTAGVLTPVTGTYTPVP